MRKSIPFAAFASMLAFAIVAQGQVQPPPLVFYDFDSESGGVIPDEGNRGNVGVLQGDAVLTTGNLGKRTGEALELGAFNSGAFLDIPSAADGAFNTLAAKDQATVAFWMFGNDEQPVNNWSFRAGGPGVDRVLAHVPWSNSNVYFDVSGCCEANQRINEATVEADFKGQWNHYAFTKDGPVTTIYINSEVFHSSHEYVDRDGVTQPGQGGDKGALTEVNQFVVGASFGGANSFGGMIDDFVLYDRALTQDAIATLSTDGPPPGPRSGDFNQDDVVDEADYSILASNLLAHLDREVIFEDGDNNFDGRVDLDDFGQFKAEFPGVVAAATGVPEPTGVGLVLVALCGLCAVAPRRPKN